MKIRILIRLNIKCYNHYIRRLSLVINGTKITHNMSTIKNQKSAL